LIWKALTPLCRRNLLTLFAAGILFWASLTMFLPTLPLYVRHVGGSPADVGRVIGGFTIGLLLFRPYLAGMADRTGRKPVLLLGIAAVALAPLGYLLTDSLGLLFGVRIFHGISVAGVTLAYSALVADIAPIKIRSEVLSYMSLTTPTGMSLGPALGSTLLDRSGYVPLFLTATALGLMSFVLALQVKEAARPQTAQADLASAALSAGGEDSSRGPVSQRLMARFPLNRFRGRGAGPAAATKATEKPVKTGFWHYLKSPAVRIPTLMMLLIGLAFGTLMTFTALYLKEENANITLLLPWLQLPLNGDRFNFGLAPRSIAMSGGLFFSSAAMTGFVLRFAAGLLSKRLGMGLLMSLGMGIYGIAMAMLAVARSPEMFLAAAIIEGAGFGLLIPMLSVLLANRSQPEQRGRIFGICLLGLDLGGAIAAPLFGQIASSLGYRPIFGIGAAMVFAALALFLTRANASLGESLRFALGQGPDGYALPESKSSSQPSVARPRPAPSA